MKNFERSKILNLGAIALLFCISHSPAQAFTLLTGSQGQVTTGWEKSQVVFDLDASCTSYSSTVQDAVNSAISAWSSVSVSALSVSLGSTVSLPQSITAYVGNSATLYAPAGNSIIYCDTNFSTNSGLDANSIPGYATAQNITSDGKMVGALLVLNFEVGFASLLNLDPTLTRVVLTHEIGHCLGFGHSADPNALMYYATGAGRQVVLAKDDLDAVTYLYPRQEPFSGGLAGCGTIQKISDQTNRQNGSGPIPFNWRWVEFAALLIACWVALRVTRARSLPGLALIATSRSQF